MRTLITTSLTRRISVGAKYSYLTDRLGNYITDRLGNKLLVRDENGNITLSGLSRRDIITTNLN